MGVTRRAFFTSFSASSALVVAARAFAADPHITSQERAKLLKYLRDSQKEFLALLDGVNEAQWKWKPGPDRWSVAETAEHIAISDDFFFGLAQEAMKKPPDPAWETKTTGKAELLERVLPNRSRKVQAPEPLAPRGITMTRAQVIARYQTSRARTLEFADTTQLPLREHITKGLFASLDPLNAYDFLLYIPLHNLRHDQQIAEVKASPGYPK